VTEENYSLLRQGINEGCKKIHDAAYMKNFFIVENIYLDMISWWVYRCFSFNIVG
jgi:hypothetical protein